MRKPTKTVFVSLYIIRGHIYICSDVHDIRLKAVGSPTPRPSWRHKPTWNQKKKKKSNFLLNPVGDSNFYRSFSFSFIMKKTISDSR